MTTGELEWTIHSGTPEGEAIRIRPKEEIRGTLTITPAMNYACRHVFLRLRWHTQGRGTPDRAIACERDLYQGPLAAGTPMILPFSLTVPEGPWSYAGRNISIIWTLEAECDIPLTLNLSADRLLIVSPR